MPRLTPPTIPPETTTNPDDALFANPRFMVYLLKEINGKMDEQKVISGQNQVKMDERFEKIDKRLEEIPGKYVTIEAHKEAMDGLRKEMKAAYDHLQEDTDKINSTLSRLNWIVITAVIMAMLGVVLTSPMIRGGL